MLERSPEIQIRVQKAFEQAVAGDPFREEISYFWADGTEHIAELACMPIKDTDDRVSLVIATGMDITERMKPNAFGVPMRRNVGAPKRSQACVRARSASGLHSSTRHCQSSCVTIGNRSLRSAKPGSIKPAIRERNCTESRIGRPGLAANAQTRCCSRYARSFRQKLRRS